MKKITILKFKDQGQDFNTWEVDSKGIVISSTPFQGSIWGGRFIANLADLNPGNCVALKVDGGESIIKYPLVSVTTRPSKFAIQRNGKKPVRYRTPTGRHSKYFNKAEVFTTFAAAERISNCSVHNEIIEL